MVDSLEDNTKKYHLLLNAQPKTLKMIVFTAAYTLEGLMMSLSLLIRSFDKKLLQYKRTAAIRNFLPFLIDCANFYIKRLAHGLETTRIKLLGPGLMKVCRAGLSEIYHRHKDKQRRISDFLCEPRYNLFIFY